MSRKRAEQMHACVERGKNTKRTHFFPRGSQKWSAENVNRNLRCDLRYMSRETMLQMEKGHRHNRRKCNIFYDIFSRGFVKR